MTLEELFGPGSKARIEPIQKRLAALMAAEGLPYVGSERVYATRAAQELAAWADSEGARGVHDAFFRAYFVDGRDLGDRDVLLGIVKALGLSEAEARRVLDEHTFAGHVDADWRRARELGITGVPTFVVGGRGVVGAQPYETLEHLLASAGVSRRNPS